MKKVKLLDCTLRDGGYINDWNFGHSTMMSIYKRLDVSGVDFIEIGFLDDRREFDINRSIQPNTECYNKIYSKINKQHAIPVAMIDFGTCDINNIGDANESFVEGIRVIFKKEKIEKALPFCKAIKDKGYKLFIQAISITSYSDIDMLEYIQKINEIEPYAFSIVDTYGLLDDKKMMHYFDLLDNNLNPNIKVGYHDHNNFQLAFSNTMKFMALQTKRTIVGDATVYGMGKSAGNCAIELLAMYMNDTFGTKYDINQYLEIFDTDLNQIYQNNYWGYKYNFYISAMQNCHPNYVEYLLNKKTLTISDVNAILSAIPRDIKLLYSKDYIEKAYTEYQIKTIDDKNDLAELGRKLTGNKILLIGPGNSIDKEYEKVNSFIGCEKPIIISVNFNPTKIKADYVFLSNAKRYIALLDTDLRNTKLILTSNVTDYESVATYILNYSSLLREDIRKKDNALLLLLVMLSKLGVKDICLAGFDGYTRDGKDYVDSYLALTANMDNTKNNSIISASLDVLKDEINLKFITETLYR